MSVYKLARKVLPQSAQTKLGNRHKVLRNTLDVLAYRFQETHPTAECLHHRSITGDIVTPSMLEENAHIEPSIAQVYRQWYNARERSESVYHVPNEIWIEPRAGWPMNAGGDLYLSLYHNGISTYMPSPDYRSRFWRKPVVEIDKVLSLRDSTELGYSHFYTDVLARMELALTVIDNPQDYTLIVGKKLAQVHSMKALIEHFPLFKKFKAIFYQDNEYVKAQEAIFVNCLPNATGNHVFKPMIEHALEGFGIKDTSREDRLFIARGPRAKRQLRNQNEIVEIIKPYGFDVFDPGEADLPTQIERFANTRHLVGIHGAGMMNIVYRYPQRLSVFELTEPAGSGVLQNPMHHSFATELGFEYGTVLGTERNSIDLSFVMPAEIFEPAFKAFWAEQDDTD